MKLEDVFERKLIEEYTVRPEIGKLDRKQLLALLDGLFKEKYQGKEVTFSFLGQEMFVKTTRKTRKHFGFHPKWASMKGHYAKLRIAADGNYLPLVSNMDYAGTEDEKKADQNGMHENTEKWHYFEKDILCEGERYSVDVDVNENKQHQLIIYSVVLTPYSRKDLQKRRSENKKRRDTHPAFAGYQEEFSSPPFSSEGIIADKKGGVNTQNEKSEKSYLPLDEVIGEASIEASRTTDKRQGVNAVCVHTDERRNDGKSKSAKALLLDGR